MSAVMIKAKNLLTFKTGKLDSNAAQEGGIYPFFTCSQETYQINSFAFDTECVLLAGNNATGVFPLKYYKGKFNAYQRTYIIEPKNGDSLDIRYLYYYFRPLLTAFQQQATGATTKFLTLKILNNLDVMVPQLESQKKIAAILSTYDDLIENNKRRITILENMAEEIYREWFVRFRFPGYQDAEFEKGIPKGWNYEKLEDVCVVIKRGVSPKYSDEAGRLVINQKCIRDGRIDLSKARRHDSKVPEEKYIQYADALINSTGVGTLGRVSIVEFHPMKITIDSHVTICRADEKKIAPIYLATTVSNLQSYFEFMASGSTGQVELNRSLIAGIKVLVPKREWMIEFSSEINAIFEQKQTLQKINDNLAKTKEELLPRLISGKLSVENLDIQFPPNMQEEGAAL